MNYLRYIFFLPGLIMHEAMHAIFAIIFGGKIEEIRLFPKIKNGRFFYGYVNFTYSNKFTAIISSIAPLFLLLVFFYFLRLFEIAVFEISNFVESFQIVNIMPSELVIINLFIYYVLFQFIWGAKLSKEDVGVFLRAMVSIPGAILILFLMIFVFVKIL